MSEPETSTKAPESDTQASSPPPPTGHHCVTDRPTPGGQSSTGEIIKLNNVDTYISKPADYPHTPSRLLLLLTGGTGIKSTNNQIQADRYASQGFLVLMPDIFAGDIMASGHAIIDDSTSLIDQVKLKVAETAKAFLIDMWLARITADKVMPILQKVIDAARDEYADAIKIGGGIYAVGYCIGGRFVMLLAKDAATNSPADDGEGDEDEEEDIGLTKSGPLIKVGAVAHAASVIPSDFEAIRAPLSFVCVENDPLFPDEVRSGGENLLSENNVEHEVQVYPGVPHGFAVVGEYQDQHIKDSQTTAYEQMLNWIKNH